jgi:peptidoglycan/LPS O-acetylase OafA/YrhL
MAAALAVVTVLGSAAERAASVPCTAVSLAYGMNLPGASGLECPAIWHITWSLAAEQQFYLLWPLLLAAFSLRHSARAQQGSSGEDATARTAVLRRAALITVGLYVAGLGWQALLLHGGSSTSRVAFAPDGRSLVLLLGCALALWTAASPARPRGRSSDAAAGVAVGVLSCCFVLGAMGSGVSALWPIVAAGVASAALVAAAAHPGPRTRQLLGARPVAYLGRISYSLYLWHEVAYRLAEAVAPRFSVTAEVLRFVLAAGLAAASYQWVELPAQRGWQRRRLRASATGGDELVGSVRGRGRRRDGNAEPASVA